MQFARNARSAWGDMMRRSTSVIDWTSPSASALASRRMISNKASIVRSQVLRKVKKGIDRLPTQGRDPAESFKHGWRLASAAIVERYPVIIPDQHEFEHEYLKGRFLAMQQESIPVPMEMFLTERDRLEGRKEPSFTDPVAEQYTPAPRRTKADEENDTRSLKRALDERLYLIMKSGNSKQYRFPQMLADDKDVPLWTFAGRAFNAITKAEELKKSDVMVHFISPRPSCHLEHIYPVQYQKKHDVYGVKIFFYRAVLLKGKLEAFEQFRNCTDFQWARHGELKDLMGDEYYHWIEPALLGVGPSNNFKI